MSPSPPFAPCWTLVNRILRGVAGCLIGLLAVAHCYPLGSGWH